MAVGRLLNKKVSLSIAMHALPDDTARLLATWMIPQLDKNGVFYADPAVVKSLVFPMRPEVSIDAVSRILDAMEAACLIVRFEALGRRWLSWPGFAENQPGLRQDRERSEFPEPPKLSERTISGTLPTFARENPAIAGSARENSRENPAIAREKPAEEKGIEEESEEEEKGSAREARPPAPSRRQTRGFGGVILTADEDPRVAAYLATLRPEISETNANLVRNRVSFDDLAIWQETLTLWAANEWRGDNFAGLFERFEAACRGRRVRAAMPAKPAQNVRGKPVMLPQVSDLSASEFSAAEDRARQQRAERAARKAALVEVQA